MTAATERYLIERRDEAGEVYVDLCEQQGGQWVTVETRITRDDASRRGFNPESPAVQRVFAGCED